MRMGVKPAALAAFAALLAIAAIVCGTRAYLDAQAQAQAEAARQAASAPLDIEGFAVSRFDEEVVAALGGEQAAVSLESELSQWCAKNAQGATAATWNNLMKRDYAARTVEVGFKLDDEAQTTVTVVAWPESKRFSIFKGASV